MNKIRFVDLAAQFIEIRSEVDELWNETLGSCRFFGGPELEAFETEFAEFCNADWCVGVSSGTEALKMALSISDVGPGDEVITVPNSFFATAAAVSLLGANPVFVDVDPDTLLMDIEAAAKAITNKTKAILPVHLFGSMLDIEAINELAKAHGLAVVEDACQAHGASFKGTRAGGSGNICAFSFYPGKNLGGIGEGGAIVGIEGGIEGKLRAWRGHGQVGKNRHDYISGNSHLDALNSGVLRIKLRRLDEWNDQRRKFALLYQKLFDDLAVPYPRAPESCQSSYHLFPIFVPKRNELREKLSEAMIESGVHYPVPIHLQEAYKDLSYKEGDFPVAERWMLNHITVPIHPHLDTDDVSRIVSVVEEHCKTYS